MFDLARISSLEKIIKDRYGLTLKETGMDEFKSIIRNRIADLKLNSFLDYLSLVSEDKKEDELDYLVSQLTIGETSFFRTHPQFWAIRDFVLPELIRQKQAKRQRRIRILSAGCATGEEPYSIAIILREKIEPNSGLDIEITACDVNKKYLERAREGIYSSKGLRNVDEHLKDKYFEKKGTHFQVKAEIRDMVQYLHFNLANPRYDLLAQGRTFDVIFCRNVLIYFDRRAFYEILDHFYRILENYGYLFLGYSESLYGVNSKFDAIYVPEAFFYQKIPVAKEKISYPKRPEKAKARILKAVPKITPHKHKPAIAQALEAIAPAKKTKAELISNEQLWEKAWQLFENEEYDQARSCFETLMESASPSPMGYLGMAFVLANQGEDELSAKYLKLAFEKDGLIPEGYYLLGLLAERREEWEKAIQDYQRAIFLKSDFTIAHFLSLIHISEPTRPY